MSRRASLPGADELFRATGASQPSAAPEPGPEPVPPAATAPPRPTGTDAAPLAAVEPLPDRERHSVARRRSRSADRRPTGRERHDEKITVYCSAEELIDLERARLTLRGDFGIAVDRGRIVREAISLVLEDLEARGADSTLVRRLSGR